MSRPTSPQSSRRPAPNIILIGLSGSGKSTICREVAARLGWTVIDTDAEIESAELSPITQIFTERGESVFRDIESRAIADAVRLTHRVIATGGGAVLREENRSALWQHGFVVYLRTSPDCLVDRLSQQGADDRPLLQGDLRNRLGSLLEARSGYYERAHAIIDTDGATPGTIADMIVEAYARSS